MGVDALTPQVCLDATAVPASPGGAGRYVMDLASALARRRDVALSLVCRRGDGPRWRELASPATVVASAPEGRPLRLLWEQARLAELVRTLGADVHHSPHYTMPRRLGRPVVVTIHDLSFLDHPEWHQRTKAAFFGHALKVAAQRADALIAVSAATADRLQHRLAPRAPVHVIPHGVDHDRFHPGGPDEDALARAGLCQPYILFLGTLEPRKDVPTLVRAFDRLAPSRPELCLVLAGAPGWGTAAVKAAVREAACGDRVRITGYVPEADKPALLRAAVAVAYPSLDEGFGLPALEALACGTPLVTTTGSAMEEVVGDAAVLVAPGDTDGLAAGLEATLDAGPEVAQRRARGLDVAGRFTWEVSAAAHAGVYRSLS